MTNTLATEAPHAISQSTDQLFIQLFRSLFDNHAIMTSLHCAILVGGIVVMWKSSNLDPAKIPARFKCAPFATDIIHSTRSGASNFLTSFSIGCILFFVGIHLDGIPGISPLWVQFLTYVPTMILAVVQLQATLAGIRLIKKHTGL
jgi:hypothetical protein